MCLISAFFSCRIDLLSQAVWLPDFLLDVAQCLIFSVSYYVVFNLFELPYIFCLDSITSDLFTNRYVSTVSDSHPSSSQNTKLESANQFRYQFWKNISPVKYVWVNVTSAKFAIQNVISNTNTSYVTIIILILNNVSIIFPKKHIRNQHDEVYVVPGTW